MNYLKFNLYVFLAVVKAMYGSEHVINNIAQETLTEGQDVVTWCTTSLLEQEKCEKLAKTAMQDKGLFGKDYIEIHCKRVSFVSFSFCLFKLNLPELCIYTYELLQKKCIPSFVHILLITNLKNYGMYI